MRHKKGKITTGIPVPPFTGADTLAGITGYRLEPIVSLSTRQRVACEVLTTLSSPVSSELFFSSLPLQEYLRLLKLQCVFIAGLTRQCSDSCLFLNVPVALLCQPAWASQFASCCPPGTCIEIQDPVNILALSGQQRLQFRLGLAELTDAGLPFWLDDMTPALLPVLSLMPDWPDGIKIDKSVLWSTTQSPDISDLSDLIGVCRRYAPAILVEGIEHEGHLKTARQAGADYGQGYYWPARSYPSGLQTQFRLTVGDT
jgi:EAL domain-containing protein (putative c-di-GMP-specific phosphodiesterase class I)